jgi:GNAT superfamily N-acetyltransferase
MSETTIRAAITPEDREAARALFREYERNVDAAACFEGFEKELGELDRLYAPPEGLLLLALVDGVPAGVVGLRRRDDGAAEVKRLYVRATARGHGLGGALVLRLVEAAREAGHRRLVLETLPARMATAVALYRGLGFREIPPYVGKPIAGALYLGLPLAAR